MSIDDSEPAFPFEGGQNSGMQPYHGMTLRDYFAAKAMQGLMSKSGSGTHADYAENAYLMADAMLKERTQ